MGKDFQELRKNLIAETKKKIRESVSKNNLIIQAVNSIDEMDKAANMLAKRLREWYSFHLPEFSDSVASHEKFIELIQKKPKQVLLKELNLTETTSMGANLEKADLNAIMELAKVLDDLYDTKEVQSDYLENTMKSFCPNITAIAGSMIAARLLAIAGSLKKLSLFPSSTIQILGAEKALFRHLKTGARSPKYGVIHEHPLILRAKKRNHGKIARLLADKLAIAAKVDYFKGEFIGDKLNKEIDRKVVK